jgi:hypothetical protein
MSITWKSFTINNATHPLPPTYSPPGLAVNNGSYWQPGNVAVVNDNLQLSIQRNSGYYWEGQEIWACAEAVFENQLNYGTYCVALKVVTDSGGNDWGRFGLMQPNADLDVTTTLGVFLYDATGSGGVDNPHCELDIVEIGYQNQAQTGGWISDQPGGPAINNGQFVVQPWNAGGQTPNWDNLHRLAFDTTNAELQSSGEMTFLMDWAGPGEPVTYYAAYGSYTKATFPKTGDNTQTWTTPAATDSYIPTLNSNMRLHINAWIYGGPGNGKPCYMEVTNVELP